MKSHVKGAMIATAVAGCPRQRSAGGRACRWQGRGQGEVPEGVNECKGKGACGGAGHDCAGKNECKGKGWVDVRRRVQGEGRHGRSSEEGCWVAGC